MSMLNKLNRIKQVFDDGKVFVAYLTAGDGGLNKTFEAAMALIKGGVNLLEIGVPFSDPVADGPVIQRAATRALATNTNLNDILLLTERIRQYSNIPIILFSYFNPIFKILNSNFFHEAKLAGIDGMLLVDCPIEESQALQQQCSAEDLSLIYVITPSTPLERIRKIDQAGSGFLYYACRKGTTGIRNELPPDFVQKIQQIKSTVQLPVVVGFGISQREMASQILDHADGFVVGSLFVKALEDGATPAQLTQLAQSINPLVSVSQYS